LVREGSSGDEIEKVVSEGITEVCVGVDLSWASYPDQLVPRAVFSKSIRCQVACLTFANRAVLPPSDGPTRSTVGVAFRRDEVLVPGR
jgi:hypothetical protein